VNLAHRPARVGARRRCTQLVSGHRRRLFVQHCARCGEESIQLGAIHQRAAGDAQDDDVQAKSKAGPQMNLKEGAAQPDALRLMEEPGQDAHADAGI
jgi:hypothetical protein